MKIFRVLFLLVACFLSGSYAIAQPVPPVISPADGSNDVWYYIRFAERDWPEGSEGRYMYDAGDGRMLIATQPLAVSDNLQWKIVETGTPDQYRIVSKNGNGIEYHCCMWGSPITLAETIYGDRYYTGANSTQTYTIVPNIDAHSAYLQIKMINPDGSIGDGIDKNLDCPGFDAWYDDTGNSVLFEPVATTTLTPPSTSPSLEVSQTSIGSFSVPAGGSSSSSVIYAIGYNIPDATIAADFAGDPAAWFQLSRTLTTGSDGALAASFQIVFAPPAGTAVGDYSATLTLSVVA